MEGYIFGLLGTLIIISIILLIYSLFGPEKSNNNACESEQEPAAAPEVVFEQQANRQSLLPGQIDIYISDGNGSIRIEGEISE